MKGSISRCERVTTTHALRLQTVCNLNCYSTSSRQKKGGKAKTELSIRLISLSHEHINDITHGTRIWVRNAILRLRVTNMLTLSNTTIYQRLSIMKQNICGNKFTLHRYINTICKPLKIDIVPNNSLRRIDLTNNSESTRGWLNTIVLNELNQSAQRIGNQNETKEPCMPR